MKLETRFKVNKKLSITEHYRLFYMLIISISKMRRLIMHFIKLDLSSNVFKKFYRSSNTITTHSFERYLTLRQRLMVLQIIKLSYLQFKILSQLVAIVQYCNKVLKSFEAGQQIHTLFNFQWRMSFSSFFVEAWWRKIGTPLMTSKLVNPVLVKAPTI